jgi:D-xylose transport system permease protein
VSLLKKDQAASAVEGDLDLGEQSMSPRLLLKRIRQGDSGMVPVVIGLFVLVGYFEIRSHAFLKPENLINLFIQATIFILLGMAEIWVLLLGEIDLSVGFTMALGGAVAVILTDAQFHWPWFLALPLALLVVTAIGAVYAFLVIKWRLPSFITTLAGFLAFQGVLIYLVDDQGTGGTIEVHEKVLYNLVYGDLTPLWTWIFIVACVAFTSFRLLRKDLSRRGSGLSTEPLAFLITKVSLLVIVGVVLGVVFNANRGTFVPLRGMPFAVPIDLAVLAAGSFVLTRTKTGRYIYAIGGNTEAVRRSGVNVSRYKAFAFMFTGFTSGVGGLLYVSQLNGINDSVPSTLTLYAVAAAVIGGTSLFGGRGKMIHAVVGGLIIATIYNGMALLSMSASTEYIVTGVVLVAAVTIDSVARRSATSR